jgi:hypothetical protein
MKSPYFSFNHEDKLWDLMPLAELLMDPMIGDIVLLKKITYSPSELIRSSGGR